MPLDPAAVAVRRRTVVVAALRRLADALADELVAPAPEPAPEPAVLTAVMLAPEEVRATSAVLRMMVAGPVPAGASMQIQWAPDPNRGPWLNRVVPAQAGEFRVPFTGLPAGATIYARGFVHTDTTTPPTIHARAPQQEFRTPQALIVPVAPTAPLAERAERDAWVEGMIRETQLEPDFQTAFSGHTVPANFGGHVHTSYASLQEFARRYDTDAAFRHLGGPGGNSAHMTGRDVESGPGMARFISSVAGIVPWFWAFALQGDNAPNTCIEISAGYAGAMRPSNDWGYFFEGSRFGWANWVNNWPRPMGQGVLDPRARSGARADGVTTFLRPHGNTGQEVWPRDTEPSRGVLEFAGGYNRDLMVGAKCFIWGLRAQLALLDPNGPDDRDRARIGVTVGADFISSLGGPHYDRHGFPYNIADGGHDRWRRLTSTQPVWITGLTLGAGAGGHRAIPGTPPPIANWSPQVPWTRIDAGQSITADFLRANPPPLPRFR
jgi:hypothetical protein